MMHREHGERRFKAARSAQKMARHGLGGIHHQTTSSVSEGQFDGIGFILVTQGGRRTVGVKLVHLVRSNARVLQRIQHATPWTIGTRRSHVISVAAHTEAC